MGLKLVNSRECTTITRIVNECTSEGKEWAVIRALRSPVTITVTQSTASAHCDNHVECSSQQVSASPAAAPVQESHSPETLQLPGRVRARRTVYHGRVCLEAHRTAGPWPDCHAGRLGLQGEIECDIKDISVNPYINVYDLFLTMKREHSSYHK